MCNSSTDKLERNIRLTMESSNLSSFDKLGFTLNETMNSTMISNFTTPRSNVCGFANINRNELIQKISKLKIKWDFGMQFALVIFLIFLISFSILALLDEIMQDISKHIEQIFTRSW